MFLAQAPDPAPRMPRAMPDPPKSKVHSKAAAELLDELSGPDPVTAWCFRIGYLCIAGVIGIEAWLFWAVAATR